MTQTFPVKYMIKTRRPACPLLCCSIVRLSDVDAPAILLPSTRFCPGLKRENVPHRA